LSIKHDSNFVSEIFAKLPKKTKKIANLRCGLWYYKNFDGTCYFKSTDGHAYHWNFSTSRLNLNVIQELILNEIVIIVDSTRKGKLLPDSLSKTIPIWAFVVNSVVNEVSEKNWKFDLDLPKGISKNERSQIEELIPKFVNVFKNCGVNMKSIVSMSKPMKCIWISPLIEFQELDYSNLQYYPLYLLSASDPSFDEKTYSWRYIQGAGDGSKIYLTGRPSKLG
jgi:tRNA A64-2'-O-ribosylphosphate transferase